MEVNSKAELCCLLLRNKSTVDRPQSTADSFGIKFGIQILIWFSFAEHNWLWSVDSQFLVGAFFV